MLAKRVRVLLRSGIAVDHERLVNGVGGVNPLVSVNPDRDHLPSSLGYRSVGSGTDGVLSGRKTSSY